ncbi:hypothetical protein MBLNU230_g0866t1 [Neophaeotheca triangularis]
MFSHVTLAIAGLTITYGLLTYRAFQRNLAEAKKSGVPYICMPFYNFNPFWLVTHRLWLPILSKLPASWIQPWINYTEPDWLWLDQYKTFADHDSDLVMLVSPGKNTLYVADPQACSQITTRRNDFPKPIEMYKSVDLFGKNVVSTEGSVWRHHRKITSPPFTEKSNQVVWRESLHQAQVMVEGWMPKGVADSGPVWDVASQAMRLSLHVISRAGFGVRLTWPHEVDSDQKVPEGHTLTYKDALSLLLENIIVVMLTPHWLLKRSPLKFHQVAWESFVEWGKYMQEMYRDKREEVRKGESREGLDLMGALVKGAGITSETLNSSDGTDAEKGNGQLLTDDEILGNAFVFILAGHETAANTIHFSLLFLAMHWSSQEHLQNDLDAILGDKPVSDWDYDEDVPKLFGSMCGAVMNEELRLIPPVIGIPKSTPPGRPQGLQSQNKQVTIPGGCFIYLASAALHRNPKFWPHTDERDLRAFRPERWLLDTTSSSGSKPTDSDNAYAEEEGLDFDGPDKRADTAASLFRPEKGSYVPFSEGYRSCLGRRFAQVEILAVLAVIFKRYSVELDVRAFMTDEELEVADEGAKRVVWEKARARATELLRDGMMTVITIQMRKGKVPLRFVKRGEERFKFG